MERKRTRFLHSGDDIFTNRLCPGTPTLLIWPRESRERARAMRDPRVLSFSREATSLRPTEQVLHANGIVGSNPTAGDFRRRSQVVKAPAFPAAIRTMACSLGRPSCSRHLVVRISVFQAEGVGSIPTGSATHVATKQINNP